MPIADYGTLRHGMTHEDRFAASDMLPVSRTKNEARQFYDRISRGYDVLTGKFERRFAETALALLSVREGEKVLEIGFGSGHCLKSIAESVGNTGRAYGVDISAGMIRVTRRRLDKAGLAVRVGPLAGDAASLPFRQGVFDAIFISHTLELFDTPEISGVLEEAKRALKPGGRLAVAAMSREGGASVMLRLYEWAHRKWPRYLDCRPIYVEQFLRDAGYEIRGKEKASLFGLPEEIVLAVKG